jgi:hypothetical protein
MYASVRPNTPGNRAWLRVRPEPAVLPAVMAHSSSRTLSDAQALGRYEVVVRELRPGWEAAPQNWHDYMAAERTSVCSASLAALEFVLADLAGISLDELSAQWQPPPPFVGRTGA